jgi:hypothetical protein
MIRRKCNSEFLLRRAGGGVSQIALLMEDGESLRNISRTDSHRMSASKRNGQVRWGRPAKPPPTALLTGCTVGLLYLYSFLSRSTHFVT